jgi:hypothetical protein
MLLTGLVLLLLFWRSPPSGFPTSRKTVLVPVLDLVLHEQIGTRLHSGRCRGETPIIEFFALHRKRFVSGFFEPIMVL